MGWIRRILLGCCMGVYIVGFTYEIFREKEISSIEPRAPEEYTATKQYTKIVKENSLEKFVDIQIPSKPVKMASNPDYTPQDSMAFLRANLDLPSDFDLEYNTIDKNIMRLVDLSIKKVFSTDNWSIYIHHLSKTLDRYNKLGSTDAGFFSSRFSYDMPPNFSIRIAVNSYILDLLTEGSPYSAEYLLNRGEEVFKYMGEEGNFREQLYDLYFSTLSLLYTPENHDDARTELEMIADVAADIDPEENIKEELLQVKMDDTLDKIYNRKYMGGKESDVEEDLERLALFKEVGEDEGEREGIGTTLMEAYIYFKAFKFLVKAIRSFELMSQKDGVYKTGYAREVVASVDTSRVVTDRFLDGYVLEKDGNYEDMRTEAIKILEE
jgi:hypothetical protein